MPTAQEILAELRPLGTDSYKCTMMKHGMREPYYGVKIEELKKIVKRLKKNYQLALNLYATGVGDAMYLAGLIADDARMTRADLTTWVEQAYCSLLSEYTVPWVASGGPHGRDLGLEWLESSVETTASAGWCTLASLVSIRPDGELDLPQLRGLLDRVAASIHGQPNRVRYVMNGFVISVGCYVSPLTEHALATAASMGKVKVDMGDTSCKVPAAADYIRKVEQRGTLGKKRRSAKC